MTSNFLGSLSLADNVAAADVAVGDNGKRFAGGWLRCGRDVDVYDRDGDICISVGRPRFLVAADADIASKAGPAAAWFAAFERDGAAAASHVYGRFAAAAVRPAQRQVIAVTDRFATFPVCYSAAEGGIRFGDRADSVADGGASISPQAIFNYLFFHAIPSPMTVFEGVHRLPPAHAVEWQRGTLASKPYWRGEFAGASENSLAENERTFLSHVETAVQVEADVPGRKVGAFLSGGTDSSTIAGMLCKVTGQPASTYSMGFDASGYDEMEYARLASKHFGTDHHEYYVTPSDLLEGIPKIAQYYDQPFGNSSAVPAWVCARRAKEDGVDKLLAGDGGDELFGGNERYAKQLVFERYAHVPALVRNLLIEPTVRLPLLDRLKIVRKAASYVEQARVPLPGRLQRYNLLTRIGIDAILEPAFVAAVDINGPMAMQQEWWDTIDTPSYVNHMIAFDWKYTLADNDLPKVVGSADLAGIDVGFPLLSDELLEFSLQLPAEWKLKGQTLRWFFKHALRDFLPTEILEKQKHGFGLPFGVWACTDVGLKTLASDSINELASRGVVKRQFVDTLLNEHLPEHPGYYGEMVWILIILEQWLRDRAPDWKVAA
ncbi:MAG: asparagine synthase C-terminal domain-containing protein [Pseudomonadota bacterium]